MATSSTRIHTVLPTTPSLAAMNATLGRNLQQFQQGPSEEETASEDKRSEETTGSDRDTDSAEETQSGRDPEETEDENPQEEESRPSKRQLKSPEEGKGGDKSKAKQALAKSSFSRAPAKKAKIHGASSNTKSAPELPKQTIHLRLLRETQSPAPRLSFHPLRPRPAVEATPAPTATPTPAPTPGPTPKSAPAAPKPQQQLKKQSPKASKSQQKSPKQSTYGLRSVLPVAPQIPSPHTLPTQPLHEKPEKWRSVDRCPPTSRALNPHGPRAAWAHLFPDELPLGEYGGEPTGWMEKMMWKDGEWVERGAEDVYEKRMLGPELAMESNGEMARELVKGDVNWEKVRRLEGLMGLSFSSLTV